LYEGFGMPILEAMLNRCPVIVPKRSCFPEIAEDAAIYFDPTDLDGLVENLTLVLRDAALRRHLGEAGVCRAAAFNWQHCAAEHASLYRSLAE
jgi:glycosyltransferase involved in cell wall biosynthesis